MDASLLKMIQYYPYAVLVVRNEKIQYINETFTNLLGYHIDDIKGQSFESLILERDHKYYRQNIRDLITKSDDVFKDHFTLYMKSKSSEDQGVIVSKISSIGIFPEITDGYIIYSRNKDGFKIDKLEQTNRSLRALTKTLEISNEFSNEADLQQITDIIVNIAGYRMAWIGKIDPDDATKDIQPTARSGFIDGYLDNIVVRWDDSEFGNGPTGQSIKQKQAIVARAIPTEKHYAAWKDQALERGYYSSISVPIYSGERVYGSINIYASFPDCFRKDEIELLQRIADTIAQNLDRYQLLSRNEKLTHLFSISQGMLRERAVELHFLYEILRRLNSGMFAPLEIVDDICENIESGFVNGKIWCAVLINGTLHHSPPQQFVLLDSRDIIVDNITRASLKLYTASDIENKQQLIKNKTTFLSNTLELLVRFIKNYDQLNKIREQNEIIDRTKKFEVIASLTSGFVHDFNNIITMVIGYSDLVIDTHREDTELIGQMRKIRESGFRASKLTNRLRSIGHSKVTQVKVMNINNLINKSIKLLEIMIPKKITLQLNLSPEELYIKIDPTDFDQIVFNLIINAKEAITNHGTIVVTSKKAEQTANQSESIVFSVEDNGRGISDHEMQNIFQLFYTTKSYGTGLGLATIKSLVEKYNGHVEVFSEVEKFTRFEIYFPVIADNKIRSAMPIDPLVLRDIQGAIVVIKDEFDISTLIEIGLIKKGHDVIPLSMSTDLEEYLLQHQDLVDTIIYDMNSERIDVHDLINLATHMDSTTRLLCIADYNQKDLDQQLSESINILMKPFTIEELIEKIRSI